MEDGKMRAPLPALQEQRELIEAVRSGSQEATDRLMSYFEADLLRHLVRRMGTRLRRFNAPEDLMQEAFTRSLAALPRLREGAVFQDYRGLLLQHANWVLSDLGRHAQGLAGESVAHLVSPEGEDAGIPELADGTKSSTGVVTKKDLKSWLDERLSDLDPKNAAVLQLYLESVPFPEIARRLGISEDAARKRFQRGLEILRLRNPATDAEGGDAS